MKREFNVIIEQDHAGYYIASVPELKGCHTQLDFVQKPVRDRYRDRYRYRPEIRDILVS